MFISAQTRLSQTRQKFFEQLFLYREQLYFEISLSSFIHKILVNIQQFTQYVNGPIKMRKKKRILFLAKAKTYKSVKNG